MTGAKVKVGGGTSSEKSNLPINPKSILINHRSKQQNPRNMNISEPTPQRVAASNGSGSDGEAQMRQALAQMKGPAALPTSRNSVRPMSTYRFSQSHFNSQGPRSKRQSAATSSWNPLSLTLPSDSSLNTSGAEPDTTSCDEYGQNQSRTRGSRISGISGKERGSFSSFNRHRSTFQPSQLGSGKGAPSHNNETSFSSTSDNKRGSGIESRRVNRVAVPSMLLRSLGDLPSLPESNSKAANGSTSSSDLRSSTLSPQTQLYGFSSHEESSFTPILDLGLDLHTAGSGKLEDELDFEIEKSMWLTSTFSTNLNQEKSPASGGSGLSAGLGIKSSAEAEKVGSLSRQGSFSGQRSESKESQSQKVNGSSRSLLSSTSLEVRRPSMADEGRGRSGTVSTARSGNLSGSGPSNDSVYCSATSATSSPVKFKFSSGALPPLPLNSLDSKRPHHVSVNFPESPTRARTSQIASSSTAIESTSGFRPLSLGLSLSTSSKSSLGAIFKNARMNPWGGEGVEEENEEGGEDLEKKAGQEQGNSSLDFNRSIYGNNSVISHGNQTAEYSTGDETATSRGFSFSQESHRRFEASYSSAPSSNGSLDQSASEIAAGGCTTTDDLEGVMDAKVEKASIIQVSTPNLSAKSTSASARRVSPNPPSQPASFAPAKKSLEKPVDIKAPVARLANPAVQNVQQAKSVSSSTIVRRPSSVRKSSFTEEGKVDVASPNPSAPKTASLLQKAQSDTGFEAQPSIQVMQAAPTFSPSPLSTPFVSPYHRAVFPELSEDEKAMVGRKSLSGDVCPSPILAQIGLVTSPTLQDSSSDSISGQSQSQTPNLSPRPSFGESLRARFTRSKSSSASPSSSMLSGVAVGIPEKQQTPAVSPKASHVDLSLTPSPTNRPVRSPKSPNRPSSSNPISTPNTLATPVVPSSHSFSTGEVENSPFDAPATAQWRVSTDSRGAEEDVDDSDFLPKVTICGPAVRRGSGAGGIGLGLSDSSDSVADFSRIMQQAKAITATASRPERRAQASAASKGTTSTATRPLSSPSNSPIMQQSHWALSSPIQSELVEESSQLETSTSTSTLTSHSKEVVELPMLQRKISSKERASWSPLELVQQRFSGVGVAMGGEDEASSSEGHSGQASNSLKVTYESKTLSPRSAYEFVRAPSPHSEQTWFGATAVPVQGTYSTPKPSNARSSRQLWNSDCVSPRSDGGADTISIASSHSCMTIGTENGLGLAGEGLESGMGAADRRAKLLQSVQNNAAKELQRGDRETAKAKRQVMEEDSLKRQQHQQQQENRPIAPAQNFALPLKRPPQLFIDSSRNPSSNRSLEEARNKGLNMNPLMDPLTPPLTPADTLLHQQQNQASSRRPSTDSVQRPTKLRPLSLTASAVLNDASNPPIHSFTLNHSQNTTPPLNRMYTHSPGAPSNGGASLSSSSSSSLNLLGSKGGDNNSPIRPLMLSKDMEQRERTKQVRMSRGLANGTGGVLPTISPKTFDYSPVISGGNFSRRPSLNLLQEE